MRASSRQSLSSGNVFRQLTWTLSLSALSGAANASHVSGPELVKGSTEEELRIGPSRPAEPSVPTSADTLEPDGSEADPVISPPKAIDEIVAEYPESALFAGVEGIVVLRLTIDKAGRVSEAEVLEPAGHGFDESARRAAFATRYQPALRNGVAVPSRILARVEFHLPTEIPTGKIGGRVFVPGVEIGDLGIEVAVRAPDGKIETARTDATGRFRIEGLIPGRYEVDVIRAGYVPLSLVTEVLPGEIAELELHLEPSAVDEAPIDVVVTAPDTADRIRRSAESVQVIEMQHAKRESADLGTVLARTQGVSVRRSGGLGSATRLALNGLSDDQVRFFLDGVPLELAGYTFGIGNIPVNLIERIEIYSGVVPTRFGADALGGAVQLVSHRPRPGTHFGGSYELGSFDSQRLTFNASHLHRRSGFFARVHGFWDHAQNDYPVDVEVPDTAGKPVAARVHRFHDGYRALGTNVELGFEDRPWAKRLAVRAYITDYDKELQHNVAMTVPYGEVTYGETAVGGNVRYEQSWLSGLSLDVLGGYAYTRAYVQDIASCVYDWFGRCIAQRVLLGEIDSRPYDRTFWDHSAFARVGLAWQVNRRHTFRLTLSPTYLTRTGEERRLSGVGARDPLSAERQVTTIVNGIEYETQLFSNRFENIAFAKQYLQFLSSEQLVPGDVFRRSDRQTHRFGAGDALTFRLTSRRYAKASYEYATRLPRPDEVFGDNVLLAANLELRPEVSHNANLGLTFESLPTSFGDFRTRHNLFLRAADNLIVMVGDDRKQSYQNVYGARALGIESSMGWTSPGQFFLLDGNLTYQDVRNTASEGTFGDLNGDRIPNRPYFFANGVARFQLRDVIALHDEISLHWTTNYVHHYFRSWESLGKTSHKPKIPAQLVHGIGLGYMIKGEQMTLSSTLEVQNLANETVFDYFGVQRPGRAFYAKLMVEY